ncbi:hypothetical protein GDO78_010121 [Eleutherodactylus coqui]|uniref:Ig-like domain-containing protein n=1 Tax=Eleutherodactylus coqui TaxID=57060 RepID=A0A8J6FCL0_ELECQ|nr:hypothetical protein GDO78_010121 [Eleutherodactylus coqui]
MALRRIIPSTIQIVIFPTYISVSPGDTATLSCTASGSIFHPDWKYDALAWLQQKPGQPPKRIMYKVSERPSGVPERFQGSGSGTDFTLTIKGFTADDEARYYCMQYKTNGITR